MKPLCYVKFSAHDDGHLSQTPNKPWAVPKKFGKKIRKCKRSLVKISKHTGERRVLGEYFSADASNFEHVPLLSSNDWDIFDQVLEAVVSESALTSAMNTLQPLYEEMQKKGQHVWDVDE